MTTLVTGGTGFLGKRLVERLLSAGRKVVVLARRPDAALAERGVRFISASLLDGEAVRSACAGMDTVFHVAAKVGIWGPYEDYFHANVGGTQAIIEGCREHRVRTLVYTSTPSVVYTGGDLANADESLPLTLDCPAAYPRTKALAEKAILAANSPSLKTVALRPHLIWGVGDPHLVPRILARARAGRLRRVGSGSNMVDMVHVENAVDAHLLAESVLKTSGLAAGRAYFITNDEPVVLWDWIDELLQGVGEPPLKKRISLAAASRFGGLCEALWKTLGLRGEPPMTRFVAAELAKDHWFNPAAARRDLGYRPQISMAQGMRELLASLTRAV